MIVPAIRYHEVATSCYKTRYQMRPSIFTVKTIKNKLLYSTFNFLNTIKDEQIVDQFIDDRPVQVFDLQLRYCQIGMQYNGIVYVLDGAVCNGRRDSLVIS